MSPEQDADESHKTRDEKHGAADDDQRVEVQELGGGADLFCITKKI